MTGTELFAMCRRWLNDELSATYKWTTAELVDYYNWALDQIASHTNYFKDSYTTEITHETVTAGNADIAIDSRILEVTNARISGESVNLWRNEFRKLSESIPTWRYTASVAGTDIALNSASPCTITSTTTDFLDAGFTADEYVEISNTTTSSNSKVVLVDTVAQYQLTLDTAVTLTSDAASKNVLLRQVNTDTPTQYLMDFREGYLTLYPAPSSNCTLILDTIRKQLTPLTSASIASLTDLPIKLEYQLGIVDGIISRAYLKSGPSTFNIEKATVHMGEFRGLWNQINKDNIKKDSKRDIMTPHNGNI